MGRFIVLIACIVAIFILSSIRKKIQRKIAIMEASEPVEINPPLPSELTITDEHEEYLGIETWQSRS